MNSHALISVLLATCVAAVGLLATGSLAALPAGAGLTCLAMSDLARRRFSMRVLGLASILVVAGILAELAGGETAGRLAQTFLTVTMVASVSVAAWLATRGIAFGDVLVLGFAALMPAWISPGAVVWMLIVTFVAAGGAVVMHRLGCRDRRDPETVALGPALLVGWVAGLVIG